MAVRCAGKDGKFCHKLLVIMAVCSFILLFCLLLVSCDEEDVSGRVLLVLNNGERNIVWEYGQEVPKPTKDGYAFSCWCDDINCENKTDFDFTTSLDKDIVLYAKWIELADMAGVVFMDKTVTYDGFSHSIEVVGLPSGASVSYTGGDKAEAGEYLVAATVRKEGYKTLTLEATLTILKAQVGEISFEDVSVNWDGEPHSIYISTPLPEGVTVEYEGNGVSDAGTHTVTVKFNTGNNYEEIPDKSVTLTIIEKFYTVTFKDGTNIVEKQVGHGKKAEDFPSITEKKGYAGKWNDERLSCVTENITVEAEYELVEYTVTYETNGGEVIPQGTYTILDGYEYATPERKGCIFKGWYEDEKKTTSAGEGIPKG